MHKLLLGVLAVGALLGLGGCTSVGSTSVKSTSSSSTVVSNATELTWNYQMLTRVWLYADSPGLGAMSLYQGKGTDSGEYPDVQNLYVTAELKDRFTRYFTPSEASYVLSEYMGSDQVAIIGVYLGYTSTDTAAVLDTLVITRVVPGSPADSAGLRKGDRIVRINGTDVTDSNLSKYSSVTAGSVGTSYRITVQNTNGDTLSAVVTKKLLVTPTVWTDTVQNIPVVQVDMFASADSGGLGGTDLEFRKALTSLGNFNTAIIDLRGNGGGSVDQCLAMTDDLIASGINLHELSHYWDSTAHVSRVDTTTDSLHAGCPNQPNCTFENHKYVFLQDSGSASCSEIMLTGIKNNSNFPLVGTYSYGKGIAQNLWETPAIGLAVITTTEFRDRQWKSYHHIGIEPTYFVADPDSQLALAVRLASGDTTALARRSEGGLPNGAITRLNWHLGKRQLKILPGAWRVQRGEMR